MNEQWIVRLRLSHSHGLQEYTKEFGVPVHLEFNSPHAVDELKAALVGFDDAVTMMKRRQIRREVLREAALRLAGQMADMIEDAEGWHGADRQSAAESARGRTA